MSHPDEFFQKFFGRVMRPKEHDRAPYKEALNLKMPPDTIKFLKVLGASTGRPVSAIVEDMILGYRLAVEEVKAMRENGD